MFTADKRSLPTSWSQRERAGASPAEAPSDLSYRCVACGKIESLDETAAVVCATCGSRIMTKETRLKARVYSTD